MLNTNVTASAQMSDGRQVLTLWNGHELKADMYIPTFGLVPNSSYIPARYLNANGSVMVDNYHQVKETEYVWTIGDVSDAEPSQFKCCERQAACLAKAITMHLGAQKTPPYKVAPSRMTSSFVVSMKSSLIFCRFHGSPRLARRWEPATLGASRSPVSSSSRRGRRYSLRTWDLRLMVLCFDDRPQSESTTEC